MECRITIVSSPTRMSLITRRTIRCRSWMSRVSAEVRSRVRKSDKVSASRRYMARSLI